MIQVNLLQNRNGFTDIEDKLMVIKGEKWSRRGKLGVSDFQIQTAAAAKSL